ncbi:hypothetical protein BC936DRAFT_146877 [Jimgerdemannia flammicorona]|uniref:Uncharacterized protein n=2 Tax=Jimgerdemannia flammicorona TaxID=994334 RepID=A0A433D6P4_9FUNG|nr:hypothetical protein BC936DRAFT_146877 [Jimgerdemannia flammicorona]RUS28069.1 hypothetical protein BC938DRAFT_482379 [Jimgerdemannia flammicorona]
MKFPNFTGISLLAYLQAITGALAKGGGRSGGVRAGRSSDRGSHPSGSGGNPRFSSAGTASTSHIGSYGFTSTSRDYSHGGYGYRNYNTAPIYVDDRYYYTNYRPTYGGYWGYDTPYGWYGLYNPTSIYWYCIPYYYYPGYHTKYYRYNEQNGAFYAPEIDVVGSGSSSALLNMTEYTDDINNYHTTFGYSITTGFPIIDCAYFSSSDPAATPADFYMRLTFWQIVEYNDTNNNSAFDDGVDTVLSSIPLNQTTVPWTTLNFLNKTAETNRTYQEATTTATINQTNSHTFNISLVFRSSNIQINATFALPITPHAAMFDLLVTGYNFTSNSSRLAILTVQSTMEYSLMDINSTTPADGAQQIKSNLTVGASIGEYSEARLEWKSSINVNNLTSSAYTQSALTLVNSKPSPIQPWLVGNDTTPYFVSVFAMTVPKDSLNTVAGTANISGFAYLDVDLLNNSGGAMNLRQGLNIPMAILMTVSALTWLLL